MVLRLLKEPSGLPQGSVQPHWSRAEILERLNLTQQTVSSEFPALFQVTDSSLVTTGTNAGYPLPLSIGKILDIQIGGVQVPLTSREALVSQSIRGEIEDNWELTPGQADIYNLSWAYVTIDNSNPSNTTTTPQQMLHFYPYPATQGLTIKIQGELVLTDDVDLPTDYDLGGLPFLYKAQLLMVYLTAIQCAIEETRTELYHMLTQEVWGIPGDEEQHPGMMKRLKTDYLVLRTNPQESMITIKRSENLPESYFQMSRAK
jgi:hypothetical protein